MGRQVEVLSDADLREAAGTPGLHRRVASEGDDYWFGHVAADPDTLSGWHHHGETTTIGYVLAGRIRLEFGPGGRETAEVGPGEYSMVPAGLIHREGNSNSEQGEIVLVRVGRGKPVFPVGGPEPAEHS